MRITNSGMMSSYLKDVQKNLQGIDKLNTQLNTNKMINKVSDDPYKAIKIMNLKNEISDMEKYNSNAGEVVGWLDSTDEALDRVGSLTTDIKTLLISVQGTFGPDEVNAVKVEINEKIKHIGEALNTTYVGEYIFGGSITDEAPINIETDKDTGLVKLSLKNPGDARLDESLVVEVSDGISLDHNLGINKITSTAGKKTGLTSGLDILNNVVQILDSYPVDMEKLDNISSDLGDYLSDVLNNRALVGGKSNTIQAIQESNESTILEMKGVFSLMQDVDFAEKFIELSEANMIYTASLQVGAKMLKPTLLDYL